jgi:hypothetical protein
MNKMCSNNDERDREIYVLASILKDLVIAKYEYNPSWQGRIKDIDNVLNHVLHRRYGMPLYIEEKVK